jgi:nucleoid-associated protein YgaU
MFVRALIIAAAVLGLWALFARDTQATRPSQPYTVRGGDTIWSIAGKRYGGDLREAVWKIQERNGVRGAVIRPGQVLLLP